jgi:DNA-binding transcriptional MerR regulator
VWTIEELVDRVRAALSAEYPGAPNGRVRDLPDRRAVRWYATTGLVDRPAAMRGRTALYGPRHLLQLVAVKRRQAAGRTLAEIQVELAGATDTALAAVARVPDHLLADAGAVVPGGGVRARFWADAPTTARATAPTAPTAAGDEPPAQLTGQALTGQALTGVPLGGGVVLLVPGLPGADDRAAITAAAGPLLDLLAGRGLLADVTPHRVPPTNGSSS